MGTREKIEEKLRTVFQPEVLDIIDESSKHAGHLSTLEVEGTHFRVLIVSQNFQGHSRLERHRSIHEAIKEEFADSLHALALRALTPLEYRE